MTTVTTLSPAILMDNTFSRHSNGAGAPLPHIPRRGSASRVHALTTLQTMFDSYPSSSISPPRQVSPVQPQPPTPAYELRSRRSPPASTSSSSSSESHMPMLIPKARRGRRAKSPSSSSSMLPPEQSTPTPTMLRAKAAQERGGVAWPTQEDTEDGSGQETPRQRPPRLNLMALSAPEQPKSQRSERTNRAVSVHGMDTAFMRKKSGEPLRSSLKGRRPLVRGALSVVTDATVAPAAASKSEPSTPTHAKSVHFDAQLEHVKLFLAEQKPLAVSRDGSPTDTSGTESDFPAFIYGADTGASTQSRGALSLRVANMPAAGARPDVDVAVESLQLVADGASVRGCVRVRNIAFEKWVAVRFTFDWWQTTSEVAARYLDSPSAEWDRFEFTIRLNDMLARIEEKTLFLAVRYTANSCEMWDNNGGDNYQVTFSRAPLPAPNTDKSSDVGIAVLKNKLEQVAIGQDTVGASSSQKARTAQFDLRSNVPLSSRYDFSASLKTPWKTSPPTPPFHSRVNTYPDTHPTIHAKRQPSTLAARPIFSPVTVTRGSPRVQEDDARHPPYYGGSDFEDSPLPIMSRRRERNHLRGYCDDDGLGATGVRRTPPGSPVRRPPPDERRSAPPSSLGASWRIERGGSEESTPSVTSTSESSCSSSPADSPLDGPVALPYSGTSSPGHDYNSFLNKFCFYTGSDSILDLQGDTIQRSHSASSVEEFLSSPVLSFYVSPTSTPPRSSSFDSVATVSGASTPTGRSFFSPEMSIPVSFAH